MFDLVRQVLYLWGAVAAVAFPIYYWVTAPTWYRSDLGRFLMMGGIGWAALYLSGVLAILFPGELARDVIRLVLIVSAGSFAWYEIFLYRKVRRQERQRKEDANE